MKQLIAVCLLSAACFAQTTAVRIGEDRPVMAVQTAPGFTLPVLLAQSAVTINICNYPVNAVPCTNLVTTYTDQTSGVACPTNAQVTQPGTSVCTSTTDAYGNWGAWIQSGTVAYTVTLSNGQSSGPYVISVGTSSGGGGGTVVIPGAANDVLSGNGNNGFQVDSGIFYYDPSTHTLHAYGYQSDSSLPFILTMLPSGSNCTAGPAGQIQMDGCPGPDVQYSYSGDGPFSMARWGTIGQTLVLPTSRFYPLDVNNALPLGSLGDVGLVRINPGVIGNINPASLSSASKLNAAYQCFTANCAFGGVNWGADGAVQFFSDKNGSGSYPPIEFCSNGTGTCNGWRVSGGTATPGILVPLAANTNPNIGDPSLGQPKNIFFTGSLVASGTYVEACTNDSTGTQVGLLAKYGTVTDAAGNLECEISGTSDTTGIRGVVVGESTGGTCGVGTNCTTGVAYVAFKGKTTAAFDGSVTLKHWAIASTSSAGKMADSGTACASNRPANVDVMGCIQSTNSGAGTYAIDLNVSPSINSSGGGGSSPNLYTESYTSGNVTNSNSVAVPMFTGYTLPANTLGAGHSVKVQACFKHTAGSTSTIYQFTFGGVGVTLYTAATTNPVCPTMKITAVDSTHEQVVLLPGTNPGGSAQVPIITAYTANLASNQAINFTQNASGTGDSYTGYIFTVDLF